MLLSDDREQLQILALQVRDELLSVPQLLFELLLVLVCQLQLKVPSGRELGVGWL